VAPPHDSRYLPRTFLLKPAPPVARRNHCQRPDLRHHLGTIRHSIHTIPQLLDLTTAIEPHIGSNLNLLARATLGIKGKRPYPSDVQIILPVQTETSYLVVSYLPLHGLVFFLLLLDWFVGGSVRRGRMFFSGLRWSG